MGFKTGFKRFLKNKFVLMAAGGLMALGLVGGAGLAVAGSAYGHSSGFGTVNDFAGRVAQQLNAALGLTDDREISAEQMQTAFSAATADLQEEHLQQKLDDAEVATEEAAAIMDWFRAWPTPTWCGCAPSALPAAPTGWSGNSPTWSKRNGLPKPNPMASSPGSTTGRPCRRAWNAPTAAAARVKATGMAAMPAIPVAAATGTAMARPPVSAAWISTNPPQTRSWGRDTPSRPQPL